MSFRNDHDAALHRVDALERELADLRVAYDRERAPKRDPAELVTAPRAKIPWSMAAYVAAIGLCTVGATMALVHKASSTPPDDVRSTLAGATPETSAPELRAQLRTCRAAIGRLDAPLDAENTDPLQPARRSVRAIGATAAPCRELIVEASKSLTLDIKLRHELTAWARAEDEIVGAMTRTFVYYESDPYALDGYRSAPQLWREYDRAIAARDQVLANLAPML